MATTSATFPVGATVRHAMARPAMTIARMRLVRFSQRGAKRIQIGTPRIEEPSIAPM